MKTLLRPALWLLKTKVYRISYANLVSMLTSTIAASQQPDPSEVGLFDTPPRPRSRNYQLLDSEYT
jgi:UDP-glucose:glycoprotein glucosyltransferase